MKLTQIFLGIFLLFSLAACQKEISDDSALPPVLHVADSFYLDKIYTLFDNGGGIDTQGITTVKYDNLKRVVSLNDSTLTPAGPVYFSFTGYYYNGADTVPVRSVAITDGSAGYIDTITTYFNYDAQNRKLYDSIVRRSTNLAVGMVSIQERVTNYSYASGKIYGQSRSTPIDPAGPTTLTRDTAEINANGDITTNRKYVFDGTNYILNITSNFTYDNNPSPFSRLSNFLAHRQFPNGETLVTEYAGYKNILSQNEVIVSPSNTFSPSSIYTYNPNGLPSSQRVDLFQEQFIFTYKAL